MSVTSIHKYAVDLNSDTVRDTLRTPLGLSNAQAQTFALEVTEGGQAATLTGAGCIGYFIRADGYTVTIDGSVSGNIALVTLPAACYAVAGRCKLSVNVSLSGAVHTLLMVEGYVDRTQTDAIVDTSNLIPSLDELLAQISAMEAATSKANTATSNANTATTKASTAAASANTAADRANTAAAAAEGIADLTATATTLAAGSQATASYADGVLTIGVPKGDKGDKGDKGETGATGPSSTSVNTIAPVDGNVTLTAADIAVNATDTTTVEAAVSKRDRVVNLLDNSDFIKFVNQRGQIFTSGTWNYCIDRWRAIGTAGQLVWHNSTDIALGALRGISQPLENKSMFVGKTYTIAAEDTNGVLYVTNGTYEGDSQHIWKEINGMELRLYSVSDDDCIYFSLKNLSDDTTKFVHLKWAALYEGSYTAETLPTYQPKGYAAELAECKRYYNQSWTGASPSSAGVLAQTYLSPYSLSVVKFPQEMRTIPTITIYSASGVAWQAQEWVSNDIISNVYATPITNKSFRPHTDGDWVDGKSYYFHYAASADL